jgi:hypothetical protein
VHWATYTKEQRQAAAVRALRAAGAASPTLWDRLTWQAAARRMRRLGRRVMSYVR